MYKNGAAQQAAGSCRIYHNTELLDLADSKDEQNQANNNARQRVLDTCIQIVYIHRVHIQ